MEKTGKRDVIYLVPHTHYDAIWVFTKEDYFYINIDLILEKVLDLLEKNDQYKFVIEQTYLLKEVETRYSELLQKIAKFVDEGRLEFADGEYLMADTMLPQGETLIREILVGKRYLKERFATDIPVMWQADSFGLNAQLPQIYRKSGYKYLAFRRGCPEKNPSEFLWEGLDGTKIISHFMPLGYRAGLTLEMLDDSYRELKQVAATNQILMPSGSGVTMPQEETMDVVEAWNANHESQMKIATPSEFFTSLEEYAERLPVRRGEMYSGKYSEVFPDSASSRIWLKQRLREYENRLLTLEKFTTINYLLTDFGSYVSSLEDEKDCWRRILFLAFHDVVPGTGMDAGYEEAIQNIGFLENRIHSLIPRVMKSVMIKDSDGKEEGDIVVFNPLSWDVVNWVEVDLNFQRGQIYRIEGLESVDEEREVEVIRFSRYADESLKTAKVGFTAHVPALGYKLYRVMERKPRKKRESYIKIVGNTIHNSFFQLRFFPETGLIDVLRKGKKICGGNEFVIEEERGDLYYHKDSLGIPLKTESGGGIKYGAFDLQRFWIDKSPLRRVINIEANYHALRWPYRLTEKLDSLIWRHKSITYTKKITVYRDIPRIDFVTEVDNNHPSIRLRVKFGTDIDEQEYTCETQFGAITRKTGQYYANQEGWVEPPAGVYPSLRWIDYSDQQKGLTLINKGNPENEVRDGDIHLTLLRSVDMLSTDGITGPAIPVPNANEIGSHSASYSLYPHEGDWKKAKSYKQGYEFNYDLVALQVLRETKFRNERSFLKVEPDNVIVTALKRAEKENSIIIRLYEATGKETETVMTLFKEPKKIEAVNLMEEKDQEFDKGVTVKGDTVKLTMYPFEIVTLKVAL